MSNKISLTEIKSKKTSKKPPKKTPIKSPKKIQIKSPKKTSIKSPKKTSIKSPKKTSKKSPKKNTQKTVKKPVQTSDKHALVCSLNVVDSFNTQVNGDSTIESKKDIRSDILKLFNVQDYNIYFYESQYDLYASIIFSIIKAFSKVAPIPNIICSTMEHQYIIDILEKYKNENIITVSYVPPNIYGTTLVSEIRHHIKKGTCLIIVSYINYMIGSLNNIKQIANLAHENRIPLFSDCIYAFGRTKIKLNDLSVDITCINFGSFKEQVLIVKQDLVNGFELYNESSKFQVDSVKSFDEVKVKYLCSILKESEIRTSKLKLDKIVSLRKYFIDKLTNLKYYDDIVKNKIIPNTNDIIILGSGDLPHILSFIVMKDTAANIQKKLMINLVFQKKCDIKRDLFYKLGITEKYIKNIFTITFDNITKKDLDELIRIIS